MYKVILDNEEMLLHEEVILKYDLLLKKEISDDLRTKLEQENLKYYSYQESINEINKKLRSKKELSLILQKKNIDLKTIDEVVNMLENQGYLDDSIYASSFIHDRMLLSKDGPLKIEKELIKNGVEEDIIIEKLACFTEEEESIRINNIINRKIKSNKKSETVFKNNIKSYLINLGYHSYLIDEVLDSISIDDSDNYQKEYDSLYKKLSKKYSNQQLEYMIKLKLYQKGFRR